MEKNKKKIVKKSTPKASTPKIKKETKTTKVVKKAKTTKTVKAVSAPKTKKTNNNKKVFTVFVIVLLVVAASLVYCHNSKWRRDGDKVYKGNETYEIGDYYEYDETAGQYTDEEDIKWKVLGVNDKGHLLIVSSSSVGQLALGSENAYEKGQNDYLTGIDKMNKIASKYANGKGAVLARSITADDVISALDKETYTMWDHNETYSYYWDENKELYSRSSTGETKKATLPHNGTFTFFDTKVNKWRLSHAMHEQPNIDIATIEDQSKAFQLYLYDEEKDTYLNVTDVNDKKLHMLFTDDKSVINNYWTADRFVDATSGYVGYGFNAVKRDSLNYNFVIYSHAKTRITEAGVRAVVEIK